MTSISIYLCNAFVIGVFLWFLWLQYCKDNDEELKGKRKDENIKDNKKIVDADSNMASEKQINTSPSDTTFMNYVGNYKMKKRKSYTPPKPRKRNTNDRIATPLSADRAVDRGYSNHTYDQLLGESVNSIDDFRHLVNKTDKQGQTPLHTALENMKDTKYTEEAKKYIYTLLKVKELDPNLKNNSGRSILHTAVQYCWPEDNDKLEIIKEILKLKDLDIDAKDNGGRTALHLCVYKCVKLNVLKLLVENDVSVECQDNSGFAPIHYVSMKKKQGLHDILKFMLSSDKFDVNLKDGQGKTPLHIAIQSKPNEYVIRLLLQTPRVDVNIRDCEKKTPLHYICQKIGQHQLIAEFLKRHELEINARDKLGKTALHYAAMCAGNAKSIKLLIAHSDICLNVEDKHKRSPLHSCAKINDQTMLDLFLDEKRIRVRGTDKYGRTVLHYCASVGAHVEVLKKIINLDRGIILWRDDKGDTAFEIAKQKEFQEIAEYLREEHPSLYTRSLSIEDIQFYDLLCERDGHNLVEKILLEKKEKLEVVEKGQTFLHALVGAPFCINRKSSLEIVLKSKLIDVNSEDYDGLTPLHVAVNVSKDYVELLLQQNEIKVNVTDKHGQTPLHYVAKSGNFEIVELFICRDDIDVNVLDKKKKSALHYACKTSSSEIIELLLNGKHQIEVKSLDFKCRSVFHYCCISGQQLPIIKRLIELINDKEILSAMDFEGKTPYCYANHYQHQHIVIALETSQLVLTEKVVSQLKPSHLKQLSDLKKKPLGQYLWEEFCRKLRDKNLVSFTDIEISVIKDPVQYEVGKIVIENIQVKKPTFTTNDLLNVALELHRNDICDLLKNSIQEEVPLSTISPELKYMLCIYCGKRVQGIFGPKIIAEYCEILDGDLATELTEKNSYKCPIETLFDIINIRNPTLSLSSIVEVFNELKFKSLANKMQKIISPDEHKFTRRS